MEEQNFKNHGKYVPLYHGVTLLLILALLIGSVVNLLNSSAVNRYSASLLVVVAVVLLLVAYFARAFSLKAQDRAIRAEENFRHFVATGKPLDNRLRMGQIIALRFAGDAEFVALAKKAADDKLTSKEIKMAIQNWRPDYNRL